MKIKYLFLIRRIKIILNWQPLEECTKIHSGSGMTEFSNSQAQLMSLRENTMH